MSQFAVLEMLYHKGDLKVGEIIVKSLSTIGNISLVIDNLVKLSIVEKKKCEEDRRITYVDQIFPELAKFFKNNLHIKTVLELLLQYSSSSKISNVNLTRLLFIKL